MGTNYYIRSNPCPTCNHVDNDYHIGKSSGGWCFALHVDPERGIKNLSDVQDLWHGKEIYDEYDKVITPHGMLRIILRRSHERQREPYGYSSWAAFHSANNSCDGPNGLLRRKIDNRDCIGHGNGTYDLCIGEFS